MLGAPLALRILVLAALAVGATACGVTTRAGGFAQPGGAAMRVSSFGPLGGDERLLTLIVSSDLSIVRKECSAMQAHGEVLGCQMSKPVTRPGQLPVRSVKIVRYAETLPSAVTFEIDAHELCHTVASLQLLRDPCHDGNGGELQATRSGLR